MTTAKPRPPLVPGETRGYPVLPLRDIVVFPHMIAPLFVGRKKSILALLGLMVTPPVFPAVALIVATYGAANGIMTIVRGLVVPEMLTRDAYGAINGALAVPTMVAKAAAPFGAALLDHLVVLRIPKHEIIFERVGPHRQMAAVWLEIEQDAGSLVDAARAVYLKSENEIRRSAGQSA
jgi:hypothetical protein